MPIELNPKQSQLLDHLVENPELVPAFIELLEELVKNKLHILNYKIEFARGELSSSYMTDFIQNLDGQIQDYHMLKEALEHYSNN